jgi:hypothetical protein
MKSKGAADLLAKRRPAWQQARINLKKSTRFMRAYAELLKPGETTDGTGGNDRRPGPGQRDLG